MSEERKVVTEDDARAYLGIDYADDAMINRNIARMIKTADSFLKGSIGEDYPIDDPRAKELALIIISDLYENRSYQAASGGTVSANTRKLVEDLSMQLRLELRRR